MKRLRLNMTFHLIAIMTFTAMTTLLMANHQTVYAIITILFLAGTILSAAHILRQLIRTMQSFVCGLEMNDSTMRFDFGNDDRELREMSDAMNRISKIYKTNKMELETRKLYYDRILKVMTHEMRNAMTPIAAITSDMKDNPGKYTGCFLEEVAGMLNSQSTHIRHFLDSYHRLTHIPQPEKEWVDAAEFFNSVKCGMTFFQPVTSSGGDPATFIVAPGLKLLIDSGLMSQVILNLLRNACEALRSTPHPEIKLTATRSGSLSLISISDNGPGLPQEIASNLFHPFHTTKEDGSGIGLFLSRQIVRLHSGDMDVRSIPGKGVSVFIKLPSE